MHKKYSHFWTSKAHNFIVFVRILFISILQIVFIAYCWRSVVVSISPRHTAIACVTNKTQSLRCNTSSREITLELCLPITLYYRCTRHRLVHGKRVEIYSQQETVSVLGADQRAGITVTWLTVSGCFLTLRNSWRATSQLAVSRPIYFWREASCSSDIDKCSVNAFSEHPAILNTLTSPAKLIYQWIKSNLVFRSEQTFAW